MPMVDMRASGIRHTSKKQARPRPRLGRCASARCINLLSRRRAGYPRQHHLAVASVCAPPQAPRRTPSPSGLAATRAPTAMAAQLFSELEQTFSRKDDAAVEDVVTRIKVALLDVDPSAQSVTRPAVSGVRRARRSEAVGQIGLPKARAQVQIFLPQLASQSRSEGRSSDSTFFRDGAPFHSEPNYSKTGVCRGPVLRAAGTGPCGRHV